MSQGVRGIRWPPTPLLVIKHEETQAIRVDENSQLLHGEVPRQLIGHRGASPIMDIKQVHTLRFSSVIE